MNTSLPKVSIITISLNSRRYIETTIKNVLAQDYENIEYLVIDGGSTDGTVDVLKEYGERIAYWVSEPDAGISDAFNKGILASQGEIITFLNSQDYYSTSDVVTRAVRLFQEDPDRNLIYGKTAYVYEHSSEIVGVMGREFSLVSMRRHNIIPHQSVFLRRQIFSQYGLYRPEYRYAMDYEHLLRVTTHERPYFIDELWAIMRLGGISDSSKFAVNKEIFRAQREHGVPPAQALALLLYHDLAALGLRILRRFGIYTLGHLFKKIGAHDKIR